MTRWREVPAALLAYLEQVGERLAVAVGPRVLVGLYTSGSLALGAYAQGRSDVDLIGVVETNLSPAVKQEVVSRLNSRSLACPARGLELVVYDRARASAPTGGADFVLELNTGDGIPFHVSFEPAGRPRFWYVIDRDVTYEQGEALRGPPPHAVFGRLPRGELLAAVRESVQAHAASLEEHRADDAVLNGCRSLHYVEEGRWTAKTPAGEWALGRRHVADLDLVARALSARTAPDARLPLERVRAFLLDVAARVESARQLTEGSSSAAPEAPGG